MGWIKRIFTVLERHRYLSPSSFSVFTFLVPNLKVALSPHFSLPPIDRDFWGALHPFRMGESKRRSAIHDLTSIWQWQGARTPWFRCQVPFLSPFVCRSEIIAPTGRALTASWGCWTSLNAIVSSPAGPLRTVFSAISVDCGREKMAVIRNGIATVQVRLRSLVKSS